MPENGFKELYQHIVGFLEALHATYLIVGGMATGVLGEPRLTHDVDIIADVGGMKLAGFLQKAKEAGFLFKDARVHSDVQQKGTFRLQYQKSWVDIIVASTELEQSAFQRAKRVKVLGIEASFPSPEDFILLKLIPGRPKDLLDVESVILRNRDRLDRAYLERWAQQLADEMEDLRVFKTLKKLLSQ